MYVDYVNLKKYLSCIRSFLRRTAEDKVRGEATRRALVNAEVFEDSSFGSMQQFASEVAFRSRSIAIIIGFLCTSLYSLTCFSQMDNSVAKKILKVGITQAPPYVIINHQDYRGLSIDIWEAISDNLGFAYQYIEMGTNVDQNVVDLSKGMIDVLIGPVEITSFFLDRVIFTRPYAITSIGIVVPVVKPTIRTMIFVFIKSYLSPWLLLLFVFLIAYSHLIWFLEQRNTETIPTSYIKGISHVFWSSLIGIVVIKNKVPTTYVGRVIHLLWVLLVASVLSLFYASVAGSFYVSHTTERVSLDPRLHRFAALKGSGPFMYAKAAGYQMVPVTTQKMGMEMVLKNEVDGYVGDTSKAYYYLRKHRLLKQLQMSNKIIKVRLLAIGLPRGSPIIHKINDSISYIQDEGILLNICQRYLGANNTQLRCL